MNSRPRLRYRQPGRCLLLAVCLTLVWLPRPSPSADSSPPPHVLILSSYHLGYAWSDDIIAGIRDAFAEAGQAVEFSCEFLDAKRYAETSLYHDHMANVLALKYRARPVDLILLSDNSAFDFATSHYRKLFPQTPVVFCGINDYTPAMRQKIPHSTGVAEIKEMGATLDAMMHLNPKLGRVAIVCDDTRTGRIDAGLIRQAAVARGLEFEMLSGGSLSLPELLERLRELPPHAAVFFASFWRDRRGTANAVDELLPRLTEAAPVPVYTHADTFVLGGVVGGVVVNAHQQGLLAGNIAVRILRGARPENIPVVSRSNIPVFDHAALERWQIDRRLLPAGAVIINSPPPSLYERYTALVWGVIATFAILLSLLAGLVVNMAFRRRAEEALRSKTAELERYFTSSLDLLGIADTEGRFLRLNPEWEKALGYSISELEGRFFMDFVHPEDIAATRAALARLAHQEAVLNFENRYRHKDGSYRWIEWRSMPQGHLVYAAARDITRRKQNAEALRASEERFRLLAELAPVGIVISDRDEKALYVSPKFVEIFGYGMDEIPSIEAWWSQAYPDEDLRRSVRREWSAAIAEAREKHAEIRPRVYPVTCKDGRVRQIEFRLKATESLNVLVVTDVSERKQAEDERERLLGQLAQSQKMESVGRLAGGVAHDFNNMLGVILGHTELALGQTDPAQPTYASLEEIRRAAQRSADLTRQLLAFARKQMVSPRVLDLNETVEGMLKMLRRLIGEDIVLVWEPGENLGAVKMDPSQIDQILANLCVNARDAIQSGGKITIETRAVALDDAFRAEQTEVAPGAYAMLSVSDDGCGIAAHNQAYLFEPFFTTKEVGRGTGLGLATVYGIVTQNNGFIEVDSAPGEGTTFRIYLPCYAAEEVPTAVGDGAPALSRGHETVLLVEDEPSVLRMAKVMLERNGYTVLTAVTPAEAIRAAREQAGDIHLLMTDVVMPEMNGRDLARELQTLYPNLKCLFMSGYTADVIAHHGVLDEGVCFLQKPFSLRELADKVREALTAS